MKASVSFCSRSSRAECSAAPSATSSAVCTPPPATIATPTASMRREINPRFFQNRNTRMLFIVFFSPLSRRGLFDLRGPVEPAVVVVVAVLGRDETELAVALQEIGPRLEYLSSCGVPDHVDKRGLDCGRFVRRHLGIGHDAQILVDIRSPEGPVLERFAATVPRHDRAVDASGRDLVDLQLRGRG